MLRAGLPELSDHFNIVWNFHPTDPKRWITAHHTARKIEGRLNATVSEISACFGNAGMAFAHAEVLGPFVSPGTGTNIAKHDQSSFCRDTRSTRLTPEL